MLGLHSALHAHYCGHLPGSHHNLDHLCQGPQQATAGIKQVDNVQLRPCLNSTTTAMPMCTYPTVAKSDMSFVCTALVKAAGSIRSPGGPYFTDCWITLFEVLHVRPRFCSTLEDHSRRRLMLSLQALQTRHQTRQTTRLRPWIPLRRLLLSHLHRQLLIRCLRRPMEQASRHIRMAHLPSPQGTQCCCWGMQHLLSLIASKCTILSAACLGWHSARYAVLLLRDAKRMAC